jgi:hypothetical protein
MRPRLVGRAARANKWAAGRVRAAGRDRYGRTVAVCRTESGELNAAMVRRGWAKGPSPEHTAMAKLRRFRPFAHPRVNQGAQSMPDDWPSASSLLRAPWPCLQPKYRRVPYGFRNAVSAS